MVTFPRTVPVRLMDGSMYHMPTSYIDIIEMVGSGSRKLAVTRLKTKPFLQNEFGVERSLDLDQTQWDKLHRCEFAAECSVSYQRSTVTYKEPVFAPEKIAGIFTKANEMEGYSLDQTISYLYQDLFPMDFFNSNLCFTINYADDKMLLLGVALLGYNLPISLIDIIMRVSDFNTQRKRIDEMDKTVLLTETEYLYQCVWNWLQYIKRMKDPMKYAGFETYWLNFTQLTSALLN